jgi:hypothetical protein
MEGLGDGEIVPGDSGEFRAGGEATQGSPAETGERRGRLGGGGRTDLLTHPGSGALSLVDPIKPPPSVITGRGNRPKDTPDRLGLSSSTAPWPATEGESDQEDHVLAPCAPEGVARAHRIRLARTRSAQPAGVLSEIKPGWNKVDGGMEDFYSIGDPRERTPHREDRSVAGRVGVEDQRRFNWRAGGYEGRQVSLVNSSTGDSLPINRFAWQRAIRRHSSWKRLQPAYCGFFALHSLAASMIVLLRLAGS